MFPANPTGAMPKRALSIPVVAKQHHQPDLWHEAFGQLPKDDRENLGLDVKATGVDVRGLLSMVEDKKMECNTKRWVIYKKENGKEISPRRIMERVAAWIQKVKEVGDQAIPFGGPHAALPWAAVRLVLQITINDIETFAAMAEGLELVARVIVTFAEIESEFIRGQSVLETQLSKHLTGLYTSVLIYLGKARHYYNRTKTEKLVKGAFQTSEQAAKKYVDEVAAKEMEVMKLIELLGWTGIRKDMASLLERQNDVDDVLKEDRMKSVLLWLNVSNFREEYDEARESLHPGTCAWIFQRAEFKTWTESKKRQDRRVLWLRGPPGFGKTVLCANVVAYLVTQHSGPVAYYFCTSKAEDKSTPKAILKAWIHQMVNNNYENLRLIESIAAENMATPPTMSDLWKMFEILANENSDQVFIVDGYDECLKVSSNPVLVNSDTTDLIEEAVTEFLVQLLRMISNLRVRLLLVSRGNSPIQAAFNVVKKEIRPIMYGEYQIEKTDTVEDVRSFSLKIVNDQLGKANRPDDLVRQEIAVDAATKADGMFLWLSLLRKKLVGNKTVALRKAVAKFPSSVGNVYKEDLNLLSATPEIWSWTQTILRWVIFAFRPLTVRELLEAVSTTLATECEEFELGIFQPDDFYSTTLDEEFVTDNIQRACRSFITLRKPDVANEHMGIDCFTVHLAHHSVKEFLVSSESSAIGEGRVFPSEVKEHASLTKSCLQYLLNPTFNANLRNNQNWKDYLDKYPFYWYAARKWPDHILDNSTSPSVLKLAADLFNPNVSNGLEWMTVYSTQVDIVDKGKYIMKATTSRGRLLEGSVNVGVSGLLEEILSHDHTWDENDVTSALIAATKAASPANTYNKREIRVLLEAELDPSRLGRAYESVIWDTILDHEDSTALAVLSTYVEFDEERQVRNGQPQKYVTLMRKALIKGLIPFFDLRFYRSRISGLFLDADGKSLNPMRFAIQFGNEALLSSLLDHGLNPDDFEDSLGARSSINHDANDDFDRDGDNTGEEEDGGAVDDRTAIPLVYAASSSQWSLCKILIHRGANYHVNIGTKDWTILDDILPLYSRYTSWDGDVGSFFHLFAALINFSFKPTLAESHGASLKAYINDESQAPEFAGAANLEYLAFQDKWQEVEATLLDEGDEKDSKLNSALIAAAAGGSLRTVQLLVSLGANVSARSWNGSTALHYAARSYHHATSKYLLECGVSFSMPDIHGRVASDLFLLGLQADSSLIRQWSHYKLRSTELMLLCEMAFPTYMWNDIPKSLGRGKHLEDEKLAEMNEHLFSEWHVSLAIPEAYWDNLDLSIHLNDDSKRKIELRLHIAAEVYSSSSNDTSYFEASGFFISTAAVKFLALLELADQVYMVQGSIGTEDGAMQGRMYEMNQLNEILYHQALGDQGQNDATFHSKASFTFCDESDAQLFHASIRGLATTTTLNMSRIEITSKSSVSSALDAALFGSVDGTTSPPSLVAHKHATDADTQTPSNTLHDGTNTPDTSVTSKGSSHTNLSEKSFKEEECLPSFSMTSPDGFTTYQYSRGDRLPPGFEIRYTGGGKPYYTDHNTKTTSWTPPHDAEYILPYGFEKRRIPGGKVYFVDQNTKTTSWLPPPISNPETSSYFKLPLGFDMRTTDNGRMYFVDHITRTTGWGIAPLERFRSEKDLSERLPPGVELRLSPDNFMVHDFLRNELVPLIPPWVGSYIAQHPPPQLPAGWERRHAGGRRYFVRAKDNATATWDKPDDMTEWSEHVYDGVFYYVDHNTNTTSWTMPTI